MESILKDIKDAEQKAKKLIENAEKKRSEMISDAKQDSVRSLTEGKDKADAEKDSIIKDKSREIEKKRQKILESGMSEVADLEAKAKKNISAAADLVMKKFESGIK